MRPSAALIYGAIAVIAISAAAMIHRLTPLALEVSILFGAVLFFALATIDQVLSRAADRRMFLKQMETSDHMVQDAFNEIDMIRSRLVSLETDSRQMVDAGVAPLANDLQAVGALLAQVTEALADTEHRVVNLEGQIIGIDELIAEFRAQKVHVPKPVGTVGQPIEAHVTKADTSASPEPSAQRPRTVELSPLQDERSKALLKRVAAAVDRDQLEATVQSIVTLPQRRARGYAMGFNLQLESAGTLDAAHALPAVDAARCREPFDRAALMRAISLCDRFASREARPMVFCPLSGTSLMASEFAGWLTNQLAEHEEFAGQLVLELTQKDVRALSPIEFELLTMAAERGFRICIGNMKDMRSDMFDMAQYGVRYGKAPASLFLGSDAAQLSDIHPEDLADLAARHGIDLIVGQVESEAQVVELLEFNLKYAQGNLFSRPRVVDIAPYNRDGSGRSQTDDTAPDTLTKTPEMERSDEMRPARALSRSA